MNADNSSCSFHEAGDLGLPLQVRPGKVPCQFSPAGLPQEHVRKAGRTAHSSVGRSCGPCTKEIQNVSPGRPRDPRNGVARGPLSSDEPAFRSVYASKPAWDTEHAAEFNELAMLGARFQDRSREEIRPGE